MARVRIHERDLTSAPLSTDTTDIAYVPGFASLQAEGADEVNGPVLCTSISQFQYYFGDSPIEFFESDCKLNNQQWNNLIGSTKDYFLCQTTLSKQGDTIYEDTGFKYAYSLIERGIPVYFHRLNTVGQSKKIGYVSLSEVVECENVAVDSSGALLGTVIVRDDQNNKLVENVDYQKDVVLDAEGKYVLKVTCLIPDTTPIVKHKFEITYFTMPINEDDDVRLPVPMTFYEYFGDKDNVELLKDRGDYLIKYVTSGGYPVYEYTIDGTNPVLANILNVVVPTNDTSDDAPDGTVLEVTGRGDCIFLLDHLNIEDRPLWGEGSVFNAVNGLNTDINLNACSLKGNVANKYMTMYTPWGTYPSIKFGQMIMPGSFAYLICLATSLKQYANCNSIAGVARGTISGFKPLTKEPLTNTIANKHQLSTDAPGMISSNDATISINCITMIRPYGQVIWGDRTLAERDGSKGVQATGFVNVRNMVSDIKKQCYSVARKWMFSQNSDVLFINFRSEIVPLLDTLVSERGIARYTFKKGANSTRDKVYAEISIQPIYPVEMFDITIELTDEILTEVEGD